MSIKQHLTYEDDQIKLHTDLTSISYVTTGNTDYYDLVITGGTYSTDNPTAAAVNARTLFLSDHQTTNYNLKYSTGPSKDDEQGAEAGTLRIGGLSNATAITYNSITTKTGADTYSTITPNGITTTGDITVQAGGNITVGSDDEYGTVTAGTFYAISDQRLKTDITSTELSYVNIISGIDLKEFTFINDPDHIKYVGVIAQDLQEILPEAVRDSIVTETIDGYLAVNEGKLGYITLGAVQELIAKNKELESRLEKLEQTVEQLLTNK